MKYQMNEPYDRPDKAGLYPIHWAAIYNRPDKIESMLNAGSPLSIKCRNKLLAHGTALHLAATNGSIEAAAMLLDRWRRKSETNPKSLTLEEEKPKERHESWLEERDSEGQTPLMRSAAPRSKRMSTIRDLLRKNLWSLGARPAEMALFLISVGANWREKDTVYGMNLLHLAIVNDHDDIVHMLMAIDKQLVAIPARMIRDTTTTPSPAVNQQASDLVKINITPEADDNINERQPLIDGRQLERETAKSLATNGLLPLQLALMYGRLTMINLLWRADFELQMLAPMSSGSDDKKLLKKVLASREKLRATLVRVFWSSQEEVVRFIRVVAYKLALVVDLILLALLWMPTYLRGPDIAIFAVSSSLTLVLALRVIYKNPGYLAKDSHDYYNEIARIVDVALRKETASFSQNMLMRKRVRLLCHKCRCIRSPRSRHCNYCDRCVQDFDHHCIYLGCCIGKFNRLDFLFMLELLTITATYGTAAMNFKTNDRRNRFWHFINSIWIAKYILIGALSVFLNLRRACLGVTMYEDLRSRRIRATKDPIRRNLMIEDTYWRYTPNRFLTGDLTAKAIMKNLSEFAQMRTRNDFFLALSGFDSSLSKW